MRARRPRSVRGFTLVELMAAAALSSLLMLTLLQVIVGIGRDGRRMRETSRDHMDWPDRLDAMLRRDLDAALAVAWTGDVLRVTGGVGWPSMTAGRGHEPAVVEWRLIEVAVAPGDDSGSDSSPAPGFVLVRDQANLLASGEQETARSVLAIGVESMQVAGSGSAPAPLATSSGENSNAVSQATPTPELQLRFGDGRLVPVRHPKLGLRGGAAGAAEERR